MWKNKYLTAESKLYLPHCGTTSHYIYWSQSRADTAGTTQVFRTAHATVLSRLYCRKLGLTECQIQSSKAMKRRRHFEVRSGKALSYYVSRAKKIRIN